MDVMNKKINILFEDNHILVVEKPVNIPVQADDSKDLDLLTILKEDLKVRYNKPGNVYLGLVHRLDRPVGGVMVFAKTSKAASRLSEEVRTHQFVKTYNAVIMGEMDEPNGHLSDYLVKDHRTNMVKTCRPETKDGKKADLNYKTLAVRNNMSLVEVNLDTGRSHQIRVQFASRHHSLWGDQRYARSAQSGQQIALFAKRLAFYHPVTHEFLSFELDLPERMPYTLFK